MLNFLYNLNLITCQTVYYIVAAPLMFSLVLQSIQFHETGKRHKENVAQKLALLTKRSVKEHRESVKVNEEMRKMEEVRELCFSKYK